MNHFPRTTAGRTNQKPNMKNNSYTRTIAQINAGGSADELSNHLAKLVQAVKATGRGGSITYKLTVQPASRGEVVAVKLVDDIKVQMPKAIRPESIFFSTEDGTLQRTDPRQENLDLRVAESGPEEKPARQAVNA